jgi:hypothetical protein
LNPKTSAEGATQRYEMNRTFRAGGLRCTNSWGIAQAKGITQLLAQKAYAFGVLAYIYRAAREMHILAGTN